MLKDSAVIESFEPAARFASKLALLQQFAKRIYRQMLGEQVGPMLELSSCDLGPAVHARVGGVIVRLFLAGVDELLPVARRAFKSTSHG